MHNDIIQRQRLGLPLMDEATSTVQYQLRSKKGRIVAQFDDVEKLDEYVMDQIMKHGANAPSLDAYRIITTTEKMVWSSSNMLSV